MSGENGLAPGLVLARWSALYGVRPGPGCPPALARVLDSGRPREVLDGVCRRGLVGEPVEPLPGVRVVGVSRDSEASSRHECDVVLAVEAGASGDPGLGSLAAGAGVTPELLADALQDLARSAGGALDRLGSLGVWARGRESQLLESRNELLNTFSEQLSESYEHISLLLFVGRFMNHVADPLTVMETIAQEVLRTMKYGWLGLVVLEGRGAARSIAGSATILGDPPADADAIRVACDAYASVHPADAWTRVLGADDPLLGCLARSEILVEPITHTGRTIGLVLCGDKGGRKTAIDSVDIQILDAIADLLGVFHDNLRRHEEQVAMFMGTVGSLTAAIDAKDAYTSGHSARVAWGAREIARAMGLGEPVAERAHLAGLLHDIGKIGVPEAVLTKKGRLTDEEFDLIKRHPRIGHDILRGIPSLEDVLPGVLHHHERWDGKGYPTGAAGEEISLFGRILAVADVFDALSSDRAYRRALTREEVLGEIRRSAGSHFDPRVVRAFFELDLAGFDTLLHESGGLSDAADRRAA